MKSLMNHSYEIIVFAPTSPSMADFGIGGLHAGGIGEGNGPGYYNLKLGSEAVAKTSQSRLEVGKGDEGVL
jgi:hypothetical protein